MRLIRDTTWRHRGISLLWNARALFEIAKPEEVVSIRQFFALSRTWPGELASGEGNTLVVAGFEGCVDALAPGDAGCTMGLCGEQGASRDHGTFGRGTVATSSTLPGLGVSVDAVFDAG